MKKLGEMIQESKGEEFSGAIVLTGMDLSTKKKLFGTVDKLLEFGDKRTFKAALIPIDKSFNLQVDVLAIYTKLEDTLIKIESSTSKIGEMIRK